MNQLIIDNLDCSAEFQAMFKTANQEYEIQLPKTSILLPYFRTLLAAASGGIAIRDKPYCEIVPYAFVKFNSFFICGRGYSLDDVSPYMELFIISEGAGIKLNFIFTEGK